LQHLYVQTLCRARQAEAILAFLDTFPNSVLEVYRAWALVRSKKYQAALDLIETLSNTPDPGLLLRSKGEAQFRLGNPAWHETLELARGHLSGTSLGRALVDYGVFLQEAGQRAAAQVHWAEALAYLKHDPYYLAWTHSNLGYALLGNQPQEAEKHLLEAVELSRKGVAEHFRCRALTGVGAVRRSLGEWERALSSYQRASTAAGDLEDRQQALWGYGHTLRLMGNKAKALAALTEAYNLNPEAYWIQADIAAVCLMMGDTEEARKCLGKVKDWKERSSVVRRFVEAELLRQEKGLKAAREHLKGLPTTHLWVREEYHCFPQLKPKASKTVGQTYRVEINCYGLLEVWVNGRLIPLHSTGKPGELLVYLLVHGQVASRERLIECLCKQEVRNKRKALWEYIHTLRSALGWQESIKAEGGLYRLDPAAQWTQLPAAESLGPEEFMEGHYSEWINAHRASLYVV
jgi:tetratricopeptide (TPR) repeat protein